LRFEADIVAIARHTVQRGAHHPGAQLEVLIHYYPQLQAEYTPFFPSSSFPRRNIAQTSAADQDSIDPIRLTPHKSSRRRGSRQDAAGIRRSFSSSELFQQKFQGD